MARLRNILVALALVGFSLPLPAAGAGTCARELRPSSPAGCCGANCSCASRGGCACSLRPTAPTPLPAQHQAAGPLPVSWDEGPAPPAGVAHPAALDLSVLAPGPHPGPSTASSVPRQAGRRLALLGPLRR